MTREERIAEFAEWLKRVGVPQAEAARRLRISNVWMNRIISGKAVPSDEVMLRLEALTERLKATRLEAV